VSHGARAPLAPSALVDALGSAREDLRRHGTSPTAMAESAACAMTMGASDTGVWDGHERNQQWARGGGARRAADEAYGGGRGVDNEQPRCFEEGRISTKEWGGEQLSARELGFVWGPLLGSRVRTEVTDGHPSWIISEQQ
jgi:hypothetical protein